MGDIIGEPVRQNRRTILTGEGHKIVIPKGVCSDHASKAPGDCCREVVREAVKKDSG
jgi:hypothetical protein